MPNVMTTAGSIVCGTQGKALLTSSAKLKINGNPVLLRSEALWTISGCKNGSTPCSAISTVVTGPSQKLKVSGSAVILDTFAGVTNGTDATASAQGAGQNKLKAI